MPRIAYALASLALLASPAVAQQQRPCALDAHAIVDKLMSEYGEVATAGGIDAAGSFVAVFANPETGSWTITVSKPGGQTCVVSSGEAFVIERPEPAAPRGLPS